MKKHYILNGFDSREDAQKRNHDLAIKNGLHEDSTIKFMFRTHCLVKEEWGLEITEDYLFLLDEHEKIPERLKEITYQPFMQPYIPMIYRYMEKQWLDLFFKEGKLRLSSFRNFRKHSDEQRGDKSEGNSILIGTGNNKTIYSVVSTGIDAFVLSTSLMYNYALYSDFKVDGCFVIERPIEFMQEISKHIPDFIGINFGPCIYKPESLIKRQLPDFDLKSIQSDDDPTKNDLGKIFTTSNQIGGNDVLFKKSLKYAPQHEYRILWHSKQINLPDFIDITAPNSRQFCREIKPGELI